jgi:hypothetical protein
MPRRSRFGPARRWPVALRISVAVWNLRLHNESMPNILIRDVPDDVHVILARRAGLSGQSLQQYLVGQLRQLAERPSLDEVLARIESRNLGRVGLVQAATDVAEDRQR